MKQKNLSHLEGFLDMLLIQVENVDFRFDKMETLKSNNWTEEMDTANVSCKHPLTRVSKKSKKFKKPA